MHNIDCISVHMHVGGSDSHSWIFFQLNKTILSKLTDNCVVVTELGGIEKSDLATVHELAARVQLGGHCFVDEGKTKTVHFASVPLRFQ